MHQRIVNPLRALRQDLRSRLGKSTHQRNLSQGRTHVARVPADAYGTRRVPCRLALRQPLELIGKDLLTTPGALAADGMQFVQHLAQFGVTLDGCSRGQEIPRLGRTLRTDEGLRQQGQGLGDSSPVVLKQIRLDV